jgi:hypothetical protein
VIVNVRPPTEIVPLRCDEPALAATLKPIVAFPEPLVVPLTVIQAALSVAVHAQLALVVSAKDPLPPAAPTLAADGEIAYEQVAAAWVTV